MKCLKLLTGILCLSLSYGAEDLTKNAHSNDGIGIHLHRLVARYELNSKLFDHAALSLSVHTLFDNAEKSGDLSRMSLIIGFFEDEDVIPKGIGVLRGRLFDKLTASKLRYPHLSRAFKRT